MDPEKFWQLIDASRQSDLVPQSEQLAVALKTLTLPEIIGFDQRYHCLVMAVTTGDLYGAGSLINGRSLSDDSFEYFGNWLVAQGRTVYEDALIEADTLAALPEVDELEAWDEDVAGTAYDVYKAKTGDNIYEQQWKCNIAENNIDKRQLQFKFNIMEIDIIPRIKFDCRDYCAEAFLKNRFPYLWKIYGIRYK
ncbi:MAG: DUF4240 domain-containing protein [Candidatus Contendobacter sp.]|nr:DUF4240 domain-containing protein [Candidatus Contendobacter sp.]MDS4059009.1 DUF4240 domain-containing protein [Candidatus Contendobacter sp.]